MRWYTQARRRGAGSRVGLPLPVDPEPEEPVDPGDDPLAELKAALTPTTAELRDAADIGFIQYRILTPTGTGEGNPSTPYYPKWSYPITALAAFAGVTAPITSARGLWSGGQTAAARILGQIRYWINPVSSAPGGRGPICRSGYHSQHEAPGVATIAMAPLIPEVWDELTAIEKERCDLTIIAAAIANMFVISDHAPYTGDWGSRRTIRGYTAGRGNACNFSSPARLTPYVCAAYLAVRGINLQAYCNSFNQAAFAARCAPIGTTTTVNGVQIAGIGGLDEIWKTFRRQWTNAVKIEEHGDSLGVGPGPTAAQILASINGNGSGTFQAFGRDLTDHVEAFQVELERIFNAVCDPGLSGQVGAETLPGVTGAWGIKHATWTEGVLRGCMGKAGWATIPYRGQTGAFNELDSSDGGDAGGPNARSSMSYALGGVGAVLALLAAEVAHQRVSLNDDAFAEAAGRLTRGWAHFLHGVQYTWYSYAKGGGDSSNNETASRAYLDNQGARLDGATGLVRMLLAA